MTYSSYDDAFKQGTDEMRLAVTIILGFCATWSGAFAQSQRSVGAPAAAQTAPPVIAPAQGPSRYPVDGPAVGRPKTPPISPPSTTPPIGNPVVLVPPQSAQPTVPRTAREALQGQVLREPVPNRRFIAPICAAPKAGEFRSFATLQGSLREEISSRLVITGTCFGRSEPVFGGLLVRLVRGDGAPQPFFRPLGRLGNRDLVVRSWTATRIEFTVPQLIDPASLPLAPSDLLTFILITTNGNFRAILTPADVEKLATDGSLTFPPSP
jgi:hypothetical protein